MALTPLALVSLLYIDIFVVLITILKFILRCGRCTTWLDASFAHFFNLTKDEVEALRRTSIMTQMLSESIIQFAVQMRILHVLSDDSEDY